jgi:hypothetical protein
MSLSDYTCRMRRQDEALVTLATFATEFEASLARGALEAIGISALAPAERKGSFTGLYGGAFGSGPAEVKVFASDRERALIELHRMQIRVVERSDPDD